MQSSVFGIMGPGIWSAITQREMCNNCRGRIHTRSRGVRFGGNCGQGASRACTHTVIPHCWNCCSSCSSMLCRTFQPPPLCWQRLPLCLHMCERRVLCLIPSSSFSSAADCFSVEYSGAKHQLIASLENLLELETCLTTSSNQWHKQLEIA